MVAKDGEGATKLLVCRVTGAKDHAAAVTVSKAVIASSLVKAADVWLPMPTGAGCCAQLDIPARRLMFRVWKLRSVLRQDALQVCQDGAGIPFDEDVAKKILSEDEIDILVTLHDGGRSARQRLRLRFNVRLCQDQRRLPDLIRNGNVKAGRMSCRFPILTERKYFGAGAAIHSEILQDKTIVVKYGGNAMIKQGTQGCRYARYRADVSLSGSMWSWYMAAGRKSARCSDGSARSRNLLQECAIQTKKPWRLSSRCWPERSIKH